jgi:predicted DCC family thiol-disulfide oxidoreductase YuxK
MASEVSGSVLLFDGRCAVCSGAVRFILARDRSGTMRFAPLQGDTAREILARHPALNGVDALVLVEPGRGSTPERLWIKSDAVLQIAAYLGGPWRATGILALVPRPVRDGAYDLFAAWRHRLFARPITVPVPDPKTRERFLP